MVCFRFFYLVTIAILRSWPQKKTKILELLTTEQRIAWRELTGTPLNDIQR
jgi:hypothetical protein